MSFQHRFVQGLGVEQRAHPPHLLGRILLVITLLVLGTQAAQADANCTQQANGQWQCLCRSTVDRDGNFGYGSLGDSQAKPFLTPQTAPDLVVDGLCSVPLRQTYYFRNVNIKGPVQESKGVFSRSILIFYEGDVANSETSLWANAIIIENGGELIAYGRDKSNNTPWQPFGFNGGQLTIHLYGKNEAQLNPATGQFVRQNQGALCRTNDPTGVLGPCGVPKEIWDSNGAKPMPLPGQISDYFYKYEPLNADGECTDGSMFDKAKGACTSRTGQVGYFGNKVLAVS